MHTGNRFKNARLQLIFLAPLLILMAACSSLGHSTDDVATGESKKVEAEIPAKVVSNLNDEQRNTPNSEVYSISDMFIRAGLPALSDEDKKKGIVCLGEQPDTLDMDVVNGFQERPAHFPKVLNFASVSKSIGNPKGTDMKNMEGRVVAKVLVDESGHVIRYAFVKKPAPKVLQEAVSRHIEELLFKPGQKEGKPAKWWVILPFNFGMEGC